MYTKKRKKYGGQIERESTQPNGIQNGRGRMKIIYNLTEALSKI
jgi:hypothetical protein